VTDGVNFFKIFIKISEQFEQKLQSISGKRSLERVKAELVIQKNSKKIQKN
jgi:hypothetical protein